MMEHTIEAVSEVEAVTFSQRVSWTCSLCGASSFSDEWRGMHTLSHAFARYDPDGTFSPHALSRALRVCNRDLSAPLADRLEAAYAEACRVREAEHGNV